MPEFVVELTEKSTFGPFTYPSAADLKGDLLAGRLKLADEIFESMPFSIKVKEVKEPKD